MTVSRLAMVLMGCQNKARTSWSGLCLLNHGALHEKGRGCAVDGSSKIKNVELWGGAANAGLLGPGV